MLLLQSSPGLLFALPGRWTGGKREVSFHLVHAAHAVLAVHAAHTVHAVHVALESEQEGTKN